MIAVDYVQFIVAREFGIAPELMTAKERTQKTAVPRQVAMMLSREFTRRSLPAIGRKFGRHHTTVMHALDKTRIRSLGDPVFAQKIRALRQYLASVPNSHVAFIAERDAASAIGHALNNGPLKFPIAKDACARAIGRALVDYGKYARSRARRRCVRRHTLGWFS